MRKSVKTKRAAEQRKKIQAHERHKRIALWLTTILAASLCLFALSATNWQANRQVKSAAIQIAADQRESQKYIELAKINTAKRIEAEAKAKVEAEMAAARQSERDLAERKQTEPPATLTCGVADPGSITVIINKKHCFSPIDWAPSDLVSLNGYFMRSEAAAQMSALMQAASAAGNGFSLTSTYRSYSNQQIVYNNWVQVNGSASAADTVSARPGYSEHQTGLVADVQTPGCALECFGSTSAFTWLTQNAADYGFINRYPAGLSSITGYAPESWHWRYIGVAAAQDMRAKGIQTLEQYYGIAGGSY